MDVYFALAVKFSDSVQVGRLVMRCVAVTVPVATRPKNVPVIRSESDCLLLERLVKDPLKLPDLIARALKRYAGGELPGEPPQVVTS